RTLLFDLVRQHRLALINPPSAFLLQSKAVQAIVWGLHEANLYFTADEHRLIQRHMLPTYMDPVFHEEKYVIKPVYGSQGDTISVVDPKKGETWRSATSTYAGQPMVYQQYVEMPLMDAMTEDGPRRLRALTTCFLIAGEPAGIGMRA